MIVAYRGNFKHPFCTEVHVAASLEALGHQVVRLQEDLVSWPQCLEAAKRAHLFLWTKTWQIDPEGGLDALSLMRDAGVPSASFHLDRYIGLDREAQIADHDPFWLTDFVFTADGGSQAKFEAYGVNHHWLPPGMYDAEARIGRPSRKYPHEIIFVGSHPYPHAEWRPYRDELLARVSERYGARFARWPRGRPIRNKELSDLYASCKVVIGDSCLSGGATHYWSDRVPETLGRGAFLIHPEVQGMADWYVDSTHLFTYTLGDFDMLMERIDTALELTALRTQIAQAGQELVLARDTYKHRLQSVLDTIGAAVEWPEPPIPNETVVARARDFRRGVSLQVRPGHPTDRQVIDEVFTQGQYGLLADHVRGGIVIDIGANIGAFSVLAAALGAKTVHAYEPEPANARLCIENTRSLPGEVFVHEVAVGGRDGSVWLSPGPDNIHGGGSHTGAAIPPEEGGMKVPMVGVDFVLEQHAEIAVMKIDCEGGEYPIIEAVNGELLTRVRRIVMEFHGPGMPHLFEALGSNESFHAQRFGAMVAKLAAYGHVEIHGRPYMGGLLTWTRY